MGLVNVGVVCQIVGVNPNCSAVGVLPESDSGGIALPPNPVSKTGPLFTPVFMFIREWVTLVPRLSVKIPEIVRDPSGFFTTFGPSSRKVISLPFASVTTRVL